MMRRAQLAELAQLEGRPQHAEGAAVHLLGFKNASIAKFAELEVGQIAPKLAPCLCKCMCNAALRMGAS